MNSVAFHFVRAIVLKQVILPPKNIRNSLQKVKNHWHPVFPDASLFMLHGFCAYGHTVIDYTSGV